MSQYNYSLIERMNLDSDAIVINQKTRFENSIFSYRNKTIYWYSFPEKGIGRSRNTAILYANCDIGLFADDDVIYHNGYEKLICDEFRRNKDADIIIFNVVSTNAKRPEYVIKRPHRVHFFNCLRYGTFRIAFRLHSIQKERIYFSQLFGGGSKYGSGEDNLFLIDCIRKGLHVYASPILIGEVTHLSSTWFQGYTEKYFFDKGALFAGISKTFSYLLCIQYCLRHKDTTFRLGMQKSLKNMISGIRDYKNGY